MMFLKINNAINSVLQVLNNFAQMKFDFLTLLKLLLKYR